MLKKSTSNTYSHIIITINQAKLVHKVIAAVFNVPVETVVHPLRLAPADDSPVLPRSNQPESAVKTGLYQLNGRSGRRHAGAHAPAGHTTHP